MVAVFNPHPAGAKLRKVVPDVYSIDDTHTYRVHGENPAIDIINNGDTTITIPVIIGNVTTVQE